MLSVILPIYKPNRKFIKELLVSLLRQSYLNYELIVVNDGSGEPFFYETELFQDFRNISFIHSGTNKGLPFALNSGVRNARGCYIARVDADDICHPRRFEEQVNFLDNNLDIDLVGSWAQCFGGSNRILRPSLRHKQIFVDAVFDSPLIHPSVLGRKRVFRELYDTRYVRCQDYELWTRCLGQGYKFANIQKVLVYYRVRPGGNESPVQKVFAEAVRKNFISSFSFLTVEKRITTLKLANRHVISEKVSFISVLGVAIAFIKNSYPAVHVVKTFLTQYFKNLSKNIGIPFGNR